MYNPFCFTSIEENIPEEPSVTNNPTERRDEKVLDLNQILLVNGVNENTKDEVNGSCDLQMSLMNGTEDKNDSVAADKPCLNSKKTEKTRKSGVHAFKTIPNDGINGITPEIQTMEKNEIPELNGENQNGLQSVQNK